MKKRMGENEIVKVDEIQSRIYTIRGVQVMLDVDLASFYGVETRIINQVVKRNEERFPDSFKFVLSNQEVANLKSQFVISSWGGRRTNPFVFTETGVAMLSVVLRSDTAIKISVKIMEAFVAMRHFLASNEQIFHRMDSLEKWRLETDPKIEKVLTALESNQLQPKQGIFFDGQIFDAHNFVSDLIRTAEKSIVLIDNFVDDTVLTIFAKRKNGVYLKILTKNVSKQLVLDMKKFNEQFPVAEIQQFDLSHDRFMIIDDSAVYHIGASLKDLGKKWFAFSKIDIKATKMLSKITQIS
ncbi:MAG TPA: ORF6N domain-containing protein [bacterium]|nr:ORF6N domain-containing protein [bacterium]